MHKLVTAFVAASAMLFAASAAQADCYGSHNVTASKAPAAEETVTMSTYDGAVVPPATEQTDETAEAAAVPVCAEGDKECAAGTE